LFTFPEENTGGRRTRGAQRTAHSLSARITSELDRPPDGSRRVGVAQAGRSRCQARRRTCKSPGGDRRTDRRAARTSQDRPASSYSSWPRALWSRRKRHRKRCTRRTGAATVIASMRHVHADSQLPGDALGISPCSRRGRDPRRHRGCLPDRAGRAPRSGSAHAPHADSGR
jgi:hypothetical protein